VLVVDADPAQRRAYERLLSHRYEVVTAADGAEALRAVANLGDLVAIVSDLTLPRVDGLGLHRGLFHARPELLGRLLFVATGPVTARQRTFTRRVANPVLAKPVCGPVLLSWIDALASGRSLIELRERLHDARGEASLR
jgi:CheY-like chemotaxis protein